MPKTSLGLVCHPQVKTLKANTVLLVLRHIEVHADENSFPGHIH